MNILMLTHLYAPEIAEPALYIKKISQILSQKHQIKIVTYGRKTLKPDNKVKLIIIKKNQPLLWRLLKYTFTLWQVSAKTDLIYAQNGAIITLPAVFIKHTRSQPLVVRFYQDEAWRRAQIAGQNKKNWQEFLTKPKKGLKIKFLFFWQKLALKQADIVIAPSQQTADFLVEFYQLPRAKIKINYNPTPPLTIFPFAVNKEKEKIIAFSLDNELELKNIIQAMAILKKDFNNLNLIIVDLNKNSPKRKKTQNYAQCLNLGKQISFLKQISQAELDYLLQTSNLQIILPAKGCEPDIALTGLQAGALTIALATSGLKEIITHNQTGILLPASQPKLIAQAIKQLSSRQEQAKKISAQGKKIITEKFSYQAHAKKLEQIFQNLC